MLNTEERKKLKRLSLANEELEKNKEFCKNLENTKNSISEERFKKMKDDYEKKIDNLKEEIKVLHESFEVKKDEISVLQSGLTNKQEEINNKILELIELNKSQAISSEDYKEQNKQLKKELHTIEKEFNQLEKEFEEIIFYQESKGEVDFRKEKIVGNFKKGANFFKNINSTENISGSEISEAIEIPYWSTTYSKQLKFFSIFLIVIFFLPWISGSLKYNTVKWSWDYQSEILPEVEKNIQEFADSYEYKKSVSIDTRKAMLSYENPITIYPTFYLVLGILLAVLAFSGYMKKWIPLITLISFLIIWNISSGFGVLDYMKYPQGMMAQEGVDLKNIINYPILSIWLMGFAGSLMTYKKKTNLWVKILLGLSIIFLLLHLFIPVEIGRDKTSVFMGLIDAFKNHIHGFQEGLPIFIYMIFIISTLSVQIYYIFNYSSCGVRENRRGKNRRMPFLTWWPSVLLFCSLMLTFVVFIIVQEVAFFSLVYYGIIFSLVLLWTFWIAGYVFGVINYIVMHFLEPHIRKLYNKS